MTPSAPKHLYSRFLKGHEGKLHFAAHSHHFWPDVSREAQLQYWDDCALMSDAKWGKIFGEVFPRAQEHVARILSLKHHRQIAFAPNTHELATRLLSHFLGRSSLTVLTTGSEFHSWRRQLQRLSELPDIKVTTVSTEFLLSSRRSFIEELKTRLAEGPDLFFISQVFFDSGLALLEEEIIELTAAKKNETVMVLDGYHAFGALPLSLAKVEGNLFYLGGGYKYAQAGEGAAFMVIPKGDWRPAYTGWFAEYAELSCPPGTKVGYANDWMAFMGATLDPSGLYRFNGVWDLFEREGLSVNKIHLHALSLQKAFLQRLPNDFCSKHGLTPLFHEELHWHGHFLTFKASSTQRAQMMEDSLKDQDILIDRRGDRLRFGFGLYHDHADIEKLVGRLEKLAAPQQK